VAPPPLPELAKQEIPLAEREPLEARPDPPPVEQASAPEPPPLPAPPVEQARAPEPAPSEPPVPQPAPPIEQAATPLTSRVVPAPDPEPLQQIPMTRVADPPPQRESQLPTLASAESLAETIDALEDPGDPVTSAEDDLLLPATRIVWDSPRQLALVCRALSLRIVAVTTTNEVAGELSLEEPFRLVPFGGRLEAFSNRVRSLPLSFFGPGVASQAKQPVVAYWILVPASVDRYLAQVVREAVHKAGLKASQVNWVEARFRQERGGEVVFDVVGVHGTQRDRSASGRSNPG
jgi:hypothetical protein